jgi:maleylacetoacetate isomerase
MFRLFNYWRSSASYRVRLALELKGIEFDYQPVHLVREGGEQFSAAYRRINPQSRVPTLQGEDLLLTQSMAILEWLEETYPTPALLPADRPGRARVRALSQMLIADVQPLQNVAVTRYLQEELAIDSTAIKTWACHWIGLGLIAFEAQLVAGHAGRYCHGEQPTFADVCLVPQCYTARRFGLDVSAFPQIARVEQELLALEWVRRAAPERQPDAES